GPIAWARQNLFSSIPNAILTLFVLYLLYLVVPPLVRFLFVDAVWTGADRAACREDMAGRPIGACWAFVVDRIGYFTYGAYPVAQRWRVDLWFGMLAFGLAWLLWLKAPRRDLGAVYFFVLFPIASFVLLTGWRSIGLEPVATAFWGGILVTLLVSVVGIVVSLPFGILLALGRRSKLPLVRLASVIFIEVIRGVPLITVLIMANTMLPLFLPAGMSVDRLLRPLVGVAIFASAYMAEVVRGGLQAVPKGQYEGAMSLGLSYWKMMVFIVLPQALRIVIPGIVNTFIGLFKDTSLVYVIGVFDLMKTIESARIDPQWAAPTVSNTGYAFAALFYFLCCFGMSRYSLMVERRLAAGERR
ncbi:MAG: amino acid transporter permease, partial [Enterovirga sp.]|nr:amino acid transporter permease [Enterovirga sp.]